MKYISSKTGSEVEIDVATASLDQLLDAYDSLLALSVYPPRSAKRYAGELRALITARPDVAEHRKGMTYAARTARIGCSCPPKRG